jgi:hypothetical protein
LFWVIETKTLIHVFASITQNNVQIGPFWCHFIRLDEV